MTFHKTRVHLTSVLLAKVPTSLVSFVAKISSPLRADIAQRRVFCLPHLQATLAAAEPLRQEHHFCRAPPDKKCLREGFKDLHLRALIRLRAIQPNSLHCI